jgi:hypothetical protein
MDFISSQPPTEGKGSMGKEASCDMRSNDVVVNAIGEVGITGSRGKSFDQKGPL